MSEVKIERIINRKEALNILVSLFVVPEFEKKQQYERIQILFDPKGNKSVFTNEDAKCKASVKMKEGIKRKRKGEYIYFNEIQIGKGNLILFDSFVPEKENCLHITCKRSQNREWQIISNYMFNKKLSKLYIERAEEFLELGKLSIKDQKKAGFAVNIFKSLELLFTSIVITIPFIDMEKKVCKPLYSDSPKNTWHNKIFREFEKIAKVGTISQEDFILIQRLKVLRDDLGYIKAEHEVLEKEMTKSVEVVEEHLKKLRSRTFEIEEAFNNNT